jgi:cytochrome c-type protein NapB
MPNQPAKENAMDRTLMMALAAALAAGLGLAACVSAPTTPAAPAIPLASLRGSDTAAADQAPAVREQLGRKPGLQEKIARTFVGQPPLIPHATDNFDEVTLADNQCLECHGVQTSVKKAAPRISDSHLVSATGQKLPDADGRRHACQLCHVPQFDAKPLVDNAFVGALPSKP